jgi:hypothetical protein
MTAPTFTPYSSWFEILDDAACKPDGIWYHAPLDFAPKPVIARKLFQNGKIRFEAPGGTLFTTDPSHLDRFRRLSK